MLLLLALRADAQEAPAPATSPELPMSSFVVFHAGKDLFVLHRARAADPLAREGLVIDARLLVDTLKARVLEARGLGEVAELRPADASVRGAFERGREVGYVHAHRFGPPFEGLEATLRLRPLADPDAGSLLYPLLALLAGSIVVGLYALYRMTAAQVAFAERRNDFVSAVSHELKTPLTAIRMHAEMLEEDLVADDARRRAYYRTITAESERLTRLIENVLELSRIERRPRALALEVGDVRGVVEQVVETLRPHAEHEGFVLELELVETLPAVRFESDALKQVLFNLIDNAIKYGRGALDRRITVSATPIETGVAVMVRDRGPGVRREHLRSIFEPFFRGERELTREYRGTGIGLSLVKGLVERMGGRVYGENVFPGFRVRVELTSG
ncbi:MAG: HAMP domain-containing sensor histidine kinase [Pseudomonadota bacterium]